MKKGTIARAPMKASVSKPSNWITALRSPTKEP